MRSYIFQVPSIFTDRTIYERFTIKYNLPTLNDLNLCEEHLKHAHSCTRAALINNRLPIQKGQNGSRHTRESRSIAIVLVYPRNHPLSARHDLRINMKIMFNTFYVAAEVHPAPTTQFSHTNEPRNPAYLSHPQTDSLCVSE